MLYKYLLLKDSFGIVIYLDFLEILNPEIQPNDLNIGTGIYLRVNEKLPLSKDIVHRWIGLGIMSLESDIRSKINSSSVCYVIVKIEFDDAHFQEEALYFACREWASKYYDIPLPSTTIGFDKISKRFIFPITMK